ncbi:MAG: hypothetical protein ACRD1M_18255, partial [Terriglobales bacterium]
AEVSWTAGANGFTTTLERSVLRYDFNDNFKISVGRYHTPIIYWNTAYHHGLWLQTTISRPELIQFGGRLIPVHFVGMLAQGTVPQSGSLNLQYDVGIGNGRNDSIGEPGNAGDANNNRAWLGTVYANPFWAYKWQFGGSVYHDVIDQSSTLVGNYGEWIRTLRLVNTSETPEIIAEAADISHERLGSAGGPGSTWNSQAWYAQFAYRLPWFHQLWKPYVRYEYIHIPVSDPVFNPAGDPVPSLAAWLSGVRYDFSPYAALKMEYRDSRRSANEPNIHGVFAQIALTF